MVNFKRLINKTSYEKWRLWRTIIILFAVIYAISLLEKVKVN
jgi:hypothetical protein